MKRSFRVTHVRHGSPGEKLKAIFTNDRDRRLWISISGEGPTDEDYAQVWPKRKQQRVVRQLEVSTDGRFDDKVHYQNADVYKVVEKKELESDDSGERCTASIGMSL